MDNFVSSKLAASWSLRLASAQDLSATWGLRLARKNTAPWATSLAQSLCAPWACWVSNNLTASWDIHVSAQLQSGWNLFITQSLSAPWTFPLNARLASPWGLYVSNQTASSWTIQLSAGLSAVQSTKVSNQLTGTFDYLPFEAALSQTLALAFQAELTIPQTLRVSDVNVATILTLDAGLVTPHEMTLPDKALPLALSSQMSSPLTSVTMDNAVPLSFSATLKSPLKSLESNHALSLSSSATLASPLPTLTCDNVLPIAVGALLSTDAREISSNLFLSLTGSAALKAQLPEITMNAALPLACAGAIGHAKAGSFDTALPLGFGANLKANARIFDADLSLSFKMASTITRAPVSAQLSSFHALNMGVDIKLCASYAFGEFPNQSLEAAWGRTIARTLTAEHNIGIFTGTATLSGFWTIQIGAERAAPYAAEINRSITTPIHYALSNGLNADFAIMGLVDGDLLAPYSQTETSNASIGGSYALMALNPVADEMTCFWDLQMNAPPITPSSGVRAIHFGTPL